MRNRLAIVGSAYKSVLCSEVLNLVAQMASLVALPWWIAHRGGVRDLAIYGFALAGVSLLFMPVLAPLGDRYPKRSQIVCGLAALSIPALLLALLASADRYDIGVLIAAGVMSVMARTFVDASLMTIPVELVPTAHLPTAISLQKTAQSAGRLLGPALAGGVLALGGTAATLWLHFLLIVSAALLARRIPESSAPAATAGGFARWKVDLRAGVIAKWTVPLERGWTLVNFFVWIFIGPAYTMMLALKVKSLELSGGWLGACEAALSAGMLLGALGASNVVVRRFGRYATRVGAAMTEGLTLLLVGYIHNPYGLLAVFLISGLANTSMVLVGVTHRALAVPQEFRVRLAAVSMMSTQIANMIGPALAAIALLHWSIDGVYILFGLFATIFAFGFVLVPRSREFFGLNHEEVRDWYSLQYPAAFRPTDHGFSREGSARARD